MNREILFRGKTLYDRYDHYASPEPDTKEGTWVYGDLMTEYPYHKGLTIVENGVYHEVDPETVGQYTGLKDKNGVKIFEGDVVNMHQFLFDGSEYETEITGVIKQGDYGWTLSRIKNKEVNDYMGYENGEGETYLVDFYGLHDESFEVIGNIHDNPEHLEV